MRQRLALGAACLSLFSVMPGVAEEPVRYNRDIRPILSRNCFACHGPDEHSRQAGVRLDDRAYATGEKGGLKAIVPGNSAASRAVIRITHPRRPMPPPETGNKLTEPEIELIKRWIDQGAPYESHWAFEPPVRHPLPQVRNKAWPRNEIDYFVLSRLEAEGLRPSPEADRYTLIRRLYLDLVGLPPPLEKVDAFVNDARPDSYERLVEELLNSPHYGERWAAVWLDLARYADSKGYEADRLRSIWPWRDWVIRAFNDNLPYDRFTILQLAGDLLPEPSQDQLIATGFHRNTMTNDEGGTDDEEFRDAAVKDRVATTGQVWMGLTWGCAQCHNHKYDPLSQREFYQLYAFFNQTEDSDKFDDRPRLKLDGRTTTLIMRELPPEQRRQTRVHKRGNFLDPGDPVEPEVPAAFHSFPEGAPRNRLGLARWLVDKRNPLTARVAVNRFWARLFGAGLVETEEDFGNQGAPPSHPELLDWLATEFMRLDWDMKALLRTIVLSATYRQSSDATPELIERDRFNRLLARGPRVRLEAEIVRDQMLAASGLLSPKMYGPPVMPLQPEGVWQVVYSRDRWETSPGEDRYRRAIYTFRRRTSPYPALVTFDAPSGEICTLRRVRTNTPLQALVNLNDPLALEAASRLAARVAREGGERFEDRLRHAFRLVLIRPPEQAELERLARLYEEARAKLSRDPLAASKLLEPAKIIYAEDRLETIVPGSAAGAVEWRFRNADPGAGWEQPGYDDRHWERGAALFGRIAPKKPPKEGEEELVYNPPPVRTSWDSERLWLRRAFEVPGEGYENFRLRVEFRGSFEVWINGVHAGSSGEESAGPLEVKVAPAAAATIRPGRNLIAIAARRTAAGDGDQYIDVALTALRPPALSPPRPDDAERAAWVAVAHVLLNLDETVTKR
jgi:mono/diheme cytochrome c family protein